MLKLRYKHFREDVWRLARDKSGNVCNFAKRQQARQYRRNHIPTAEFVQIAPVDEAKPQWKDIDESPV